MATTISRPFRFGVQSFSAASGAAWGEFARRAEGLGYAVLSVAEHYFGPGWVADTSRHRPIDLAPLTALATAAAATTTLRVGSRMFNIDFHQPVALAKELATLDLMSNGRLEVGLGAGWIQAEYEGAGLTMDSAGTRIDRLADVVELLKAHWGGDDIDLDLDHLRVHGFAGRPIPVQKPHPPIMIGGGREKILRLAGREANTVSLNFDNSKGALGAHSVTTSNARTTAMQVEWVKEGAGDRFGEIELEVGAFFLNVGSRSKAALSETAIRYGFDEHDLQDHPRALIGSVEGVCEVLIERRERYGISYITVLDNAIDEFAPVVARLAGT